MDKVLVENFLLRETLKSKDEEPDWLWDAIWKAHLDTVTGVRTRNLETYREVNCNKEDEEGEDRKTLWSLYQIIKDEKTPFNSKDLMKAIQPQEPGEIEFGALQKLVNMTLKYILILKMFGKLNMELDEANCDCPIDSTILEKLDECCKKEGMECVAHGKWTEMKEGTYQEVQAKITKYLEKKRPDVRGNIWFDFLMWKADEEKEPKAVTKSEDFLIEDDVLKRYRGPGGHVVIPDGVACIGNGAFENCFRLTKVTIPDSVTRMEGFAFSECYALTHVTIPEGVTSIEECAFCGCIALPRITIPDSVTSIEASAFERCIALTSVVIPDGVKRIDDLAFSDCISLTRVTIPDSVTRIGDCAFSGCTNLTDVTIPKNLEKMGECVFQDCPFQPDIEGV